MNFDTATAFVLHSSWC